MSRASAPSRSCNSAKSLRENMHASTFALSGRNSGQFVEYPALDIGIDGPWLFWPTEPSPTLRRSLETHGQLQPVLVDGSGSKPLLLAGRARVLCLRDLQRPAFCLDLGTTDAWTRGVVSAQSNAGLEVGDGQAVAALRYFLGLDSGAALQVFDILGVDPRSKRAGLLLSWLELPPVWDGLLLAGHVPLAGADALRAMGPDDLSELLPLFGGFSWSRGNALNLLNWLRETGARNRCSVRSLLQEAGAAAAIAAGLSPKDAMARIVGEVRRLRYPRLDSMERNFTDAAKAMTAGTAWRLTQPDQFESNGVELSLRVKDRAALGRAVQDLVDMAGRAEWERLFSGDDQ